mgnify:FL=1
MVCVALALTHTHINQSLLFIQVLLLACGRHYSRGSKDDRCCWICRLFIRTTLERTTTATACQRASKVSLESREYLYCVWCRCRTHSFAHAPTCSPTRSLIDTNRYNVNTLYSIDIAPTIKDNYWQYLVTCLGSAHFSVRVHVLRLLTIILHAVVGMFTILAPSCCSLPLRLADS